jgi:hypothetical protein
MLQDLSPLRPTIVEEIVAALTPHPKGLRRWSVMRAIRKDREAVSREIPLKLEADVERTFRRFCRDDGRPASGTALFCRPAEKAGEVWALDACYASGGDGPSRWPGGGGLPVVHAIGRPARGPGRQAVARVPHHQASGATLIL